MKCDVSSQQGGLTFPSVSDFHSPLRPALSSFSFNLTDLPRLVSLLCDAAGDGGDGEEEEGSHSFGRPCVVRGRRPHVKLHFLSFLPSFHVRLTGQSDGFGKGGPHVVGPWDPMLASSLILRCESKEIMLRSFSDWLWTRQK